VVRADQLDRARELSSDFEQVILVTGGTERQDSVRRGLDVLEAVEVIAVHDVARPMATVDLLRSGVAALTDHDGAVPAIPVADTLKEVSGDVAVCTLDRRRLRAVQTPQVFRSDALREAHRRAVDEEWVVTDDAQLLEMAGFSVGIFTGDPGNFKITTPHDLVMARLLADSGVIR
jgi:2-C-methyl-D-erythritol 4-phosphate cytidylyltransferase